MFYNLFKRYLESLLLEYTNVYVFEGVQVKSSSFGKTLEKHGSTT